MGWITLTTDDVLSRMSQAEVELLQDILESAETDPLTEILAEVVQDVRGYVASWPGNALGTGDTIPAKLKTCALVLARNRLLTRYPDVGLMSDDRREEGRNAIKQLERVADGKFAVDQAASPVTGETAAQGTGIEVQRPCTRFSRDQLDGL